MLHSRALQCLGSEVRMRAPEWGCRNAKFAYKIMYTFLGRVPIDFIRFSKKSVA